MPSLNDPGLVAARRPVSGHSRLLDRVSVVLSLWHRRMRTRRSLSRLDDHLLQDIGIDPVTRDREMRKPFWRP
jgi:uncharacterized protein YjiS (DUF1127 family)